MWSGIRFTWECPVRSEVWLGRIVGPAFVVSQGVTISRVRTASSGVARPLEVTIVVAVALVIWRVALGWNWSSAQGTFEWTLLGIAVMAAVGWLAVRGRPVLGLLAVCVPIIVLSGWRMVAAPVVDWPVGLAALIFTLTAICIVSASIGAWVRRLRD